jgi:hypothetical protein
MNTPRINDGKQRWPRLIEIIGPAGAGKTTLCNLLNQPENEIRLRNFPDIRKAANVPFFILYGSRLIPTVIDHPSNCDRWISRREFAWLTILNGWSNILQKELKRSNGIILLDQGPIYLLTETREFGPEYLRKKKAAKRFWSDLYSQWADVLDMVVWLDAADVDLTERIRSRDKEHPVKDRSIETTLEFLICYRKAYERVISCLTAKHPELKILRFDTSQTSPLEIASKLLIEFGST